MRITPPPSSPVQNPTRVLAGREALVQLYLDKRRTRTVLVKPPQLLVQENLSAKMPAAMPSYSAHLD